MARPALSESIDEVQTKQRREIHEARRGFGKLKEKCYLDYPQFHKPDHPDYDKNFHCLEEIQKQDSLLRAKQKKELCIQFNIQCSDK